MCAAQGGPPPAPAFRKIVASLAPELLKGPFDHAGRAEVGLGREYYDLSAWPPAEAAAAVPPAAAAAAKGRAPAGGGAAAGITGGGAAAPAAAVGDGGQGLDELRRRLELMLESEAAAAGA